jgi:hypothetical protein
VATYERGDSVHAVEGRAEAQVVVGAQARGRRAQVLLVDESAGLVDHVQREEHRDGDGVGVGAEIGTRCTVDALLVCPREPHDLADSCPGVTDLLGSGAKLSPAESRTIATIVIGQKVISTLNSPRGHFTWITFVLIECIPRYFHLESVGALADSCPDPSAL